MFFSLFSQSPAPASARDHKDMNEIFANLYIGNQRASESYGSLFDMVVNCTPDVPFAIPPGNPGVRVRVNIDDHPSRNSYMLHIARKSGVLEKMHEMLERGKTVLVHCHAGMQRSCAIVAFYLVKYYNLTLKDAMALIQEQRPVAFYGHATFLPALQEYERTKNL